LFKERDSSKIAINAIPSIFPAQAASLQRDFIGATLKLPGILKVVATEDALTLSWASIFLSEPI